MDGGEFSRTGKNNHKVLKGIYNNIDIDNKDRLIMNDRKSKKNQMLKVTTEVLVENPSDQDIRQLQKEVQRILFSNVRWHTSQSNT